MMWCQQARRRLRVEEWFGLLLVAGALLAFAYWWLACSPSWSLVWWLASKRLMTDLTSVQVVSRSSDRPTPPWPAAPPPSPLPQPCLRRISRPGRRGVSDRLRHPWKLKSPVPTPPSLAGFLRPQRQLVCSASLARALSRCLATVSTAAVAEAVLGGGVAVPAGLSPAAPSSRPLPHWQWRAGLGWRASVGTRRVPVLEQVTSSFMSQAAAASSLLITPSLI